jgi:hypothetical protein
MYKSGLQRHFYIAGLTQDYFQPEQEDDAGRVFRVQDKKASSNEYYVAKALERVGLDFQFQLSIAGGKVAFGMVLDFLVYTVPLPTPVWVHGEHWHMGDRRAKDLRQMAMLSELMGTQVATPIEIWGTESNTENDAYLTVRRYLL